MGRLLPAHLYLVRLCTSRRGMPRACPVESHDISYTPALKSRLDATGLSRGVSRSQLCSSECVAPRDKPVASLFFSLDLC